MSNTETSKQVCLLFSKGRKFFATVRLSYLLTLISLPLRPSF